MTTVLILQRGHHGRPPKPGSRGTNGEQELVGLVADEAVELAHRYGVAVRVIDADEPLAAYGGADAFVAVHGDGSTDSSVRGAHYGHRTPEGKALGRRFLAAMDAVGWPGGFRAPNGTGALSGYYGTRYAVAAGTRTATIIECGFLTNPEDRAWLFTHPDLVAHAILAAVARTEPDVDGTRLPVDDDEPAPTHDSHGNKTTLARDHPENIMAQLSTVREGDSGADVRRAQSLLAAAGHIPANTFSGAEPDGVFGGGTDDAVRDFQHEKGISVDGIVGPVTWRKLCGVR